MSELTTNSVTINFAFLLPMGLVYGVSGIELDLIYTILSYPLQSSDKVPNVIVISHVKKMGSM